MRQGPLAGRYGAAAAMVVFALVPYLALSSALQPITPVIARELDTSAQTIALASGLANAGYAVGTIVAVLLALHLPQRRLLIVYGALLVIGSVLAATAPDPGLFIAGHVLQGLCTSLLLIAAVPPLIIGFPPAKMRWSVMILNVCVFGAVALGPVVGGIEADANAWRPLFWILTGIAVGALSLAVLTFEDAPPLDRSAPRDPVPVALAAVGCVAAFFGASELLTHRFLSAVVFVPLIGGLALILVLIVHQYRTRRPLLIVRSLASTLPVSGIVVAICAAAASTSAVGVSVMLLQGRFTPLHLGVLFLPEFGGAVLAAIAFGLVFRTRGLHYLVLGGMACLAAGILVIRGAMPPTETRTAISAGLIGVGVGASVTPALFIAGFSLSSAAVQRVFAGIELLRAVAAFMIVPILLHLAATVGANPAAGADIALWICFGLAVGGTLLGIYLYVLGRVRPPSPSMERWTSGAGPGWESPPLLAGIRGDSAERALAERMARTPDDLPRLRAARTLDERAA